MANVPLKSLKFPGLDNIYTVPQIDSSLTQEGYAADAKAVRDAVASADSEIAYVPFDTKVTTVDLVPMDDSWFIRKGYIRHAGLSSAGQISANNSYTTYCFKARQDMLITGCDFSGYDSNHWGCIRVSNEEPVNGVGNPWTGSLYDTIAGNIPTSESPATVLKGQWVAAHYYRTGTAGDNWTLHLQETGAKVLQPDIPLTPAMLSYVDNLAGGTVKYASSQTLSNVQKAQARENIGAGEPVTIDDTLTVEGAAADAKAAGEKIANLKSAFEQDVLFPENTGFTDRISSDAIKLSFDDSKLGIKKFTSLIPNNGKLISSNGSDSWVFTTPYAGFSFGINKTNSSVYVLSSKPVGVINETLNIVTQLTGTADNDGVFNNFTATSYPKGTIILFTKQKTNAELIKTTIQNPFTTPRLELNGVQDTFARYSVRSNDPNAYTGINVVKVANKLVNTTNGSLSNNNSYDTYYMYCPVSSISVTCTNAYRCVLTIKDPTEISGNGYLAQVVYSSSGDRVITFNVPYGHYVVFSCSNSTTTEIDLKTDYVRSFTLPTLRLVYGQKNGFYKIAKSGSATYVYIYYVSGSKIVGWELHNVPAAGSNSNTWQIGHVMGYDFDGRQVSSGVELVAGGEFELAFKEYGAADYCGGNNHGDENTVDFTLMIDGKTIDLTNIDEDFHAFDRIDAIEHALVNRCDTPTENIVKHQKIWTFENGTVKVRQTVEFLEDLECDFLCCMMPANRSAFTHGVRQGRVGVEDMSTSSFNKISTSGNEMMYLMYGTNVTAKVTARLPEHTPAGSLWINNAESLNKLYYNYFGQMPRTTVASGTVLKWEQEYDIAYN